VGDPPPLVVALRPLWLGDLLTGIPALRALRDSFPAHRLVLAAPAVFAPIAAASGAVDEVVATAPDTALSAFLHGADVAVDLHGRGPRSHRVLLESRARRLVAFAHPNVAETAGLPEWREDEQEAHRWCRLLTESGIPADPKRLDLDPARFIAFDFARDATVVHPGAKSASRRWPAKRFAAVASAEAEAGRRVLVTGSVQERALAESVARAAGLPEQAIVAGKTTLTQLAGIVASAGCLISNDTGVAHLATAFGTPSVVLFGPTPPTLWGPPPERRGHVALWAGRRGDPHGDATDVGLLELSVEDVLEAVTELRGASFSTSLATPRTRELARAKEMS